MRSLNYAAISRTLETEARYLRRRDLGRYENQDIKRVSVTAIILADGECVSVCVFFRKRNIHARMKFEYLNHAHRTPKANQLDRAINCVRLVFTPNWKQALEYLFLFRVWAQMKHIHKTSSPLATHTRLRSPTSLYAQLATPKAAELLLWGGFPPQGKLQYAESNKFFTLCTPWNTRPRPVFPRTTPSGRGLTCCAATNRTGLAYFRFVPVRNEEARSHQEQQ